MNADAAAGDPPQPGATADVARPAIPPVAASPPAPAFVCALRFTGRGDEYFRIWIVNLFLTVITFGIYSAWAKVRKTKYFWQNTRLDGHVFDFHGQPLPILRGRILALVLLIAYSWGFQFSRTAGLVTIAILLAVGPWLFVKAQQFRFGNTSYRGLRFGFRATRGDGYRVVLPILAVWFSTTVAAAFVTLPAARSGVRLILAVLVTAALVPGMHHRLKAFQHRQAAYGDRNFDFVPARGAFYWVYVKSLLLVGIVSAVATLLVLLVVIPLSIAGATDDPSDVTWFVAGALITVIVYAFAWPYFAARLQQVVWSHTTLDDVAFHTQIAAWPLCKLVLRNVGLTLVTLGLYWPYATIALARYRIESLRVESGAPLAAIAAATELPRDAAALGDAAADSFGLDLGL